ncbi:MAG: murein biosynthesis integral membrane protein MurJ [Candidatus Doudnabacteria bacterium RIFCSPHIGHO2_02_FULL_46_11]|uniref:Probable lipid II flippase MurJ n=1 Tax=Candidatus Doudnabacteria bacterium RIFCSPHIGHO2_02_FULL_46_11 TaxID=1817832 RepID=A0A1F5P4C7_9BACT|nr:MAG: murein biosynthesis integral membrane protein MurJ [Candidatus Doudnabacteria bacterium RIFCSPHIGHO2_02_FULL_46_11]
MTASGIHINRMSAISRATLVLAIFTLLSRLLGLVRDLILAGTFGVGAELDTYNAAFRIPDFLFNFFILGTLTVAFLPIFNRDLMVDKERAERFAGAVYALSVAGMAVVSVLVFAFASPLVQGLFPSFSPEQQALTAKMTRLMLLSPILFTASNMAAVLLQSFNKFLPTALAPILYNFGIIIGALVFSQYLGLMGLAYGVILGAIMHAVANIVPLKTLPLKLYFSFNTKLVEFKELWRLYLPRLFAFDTFYLSLFIATLVAQGLAAGSITAFTFAHVLYGVPAGIFAISFAVAAFPALSQAWAVRQYQDFKSIVWRTSLQILYFIVPISALMFIMRLQIVRLVYGRERVGWEETILIAQTLGVLLISLFAQSLIPLLARSFYATHNTAIPVLVSLITTAINVILAIRLSQTYGVVGIGIATTIAAITGFIILLFLLRLRVGRVGALTITERLLKILISTIVAATGAYAALYTVAPAVNTGTALGIFIQISVATVLALIIYLITGLLLNLPEAKTVVRRTGSWLKALARPVDALVSYIE